MAVLLPVPRGADDLEMLGFVRLCNRDSREGDTRIPLMAPPLQARRRSLEMPIFEHHRATAMLGCDAGGLRQQSTRDVSDAHGGGGTEAGGESARPQRQPQRRAEATGGRETGARGNRHRNRIQRAPPAAVATRHRCAPCSPASAPPPPRIPAQARRCLVLTMLPCRSWRHSRTQRCAAHRTNPPCLFSNDCSRRSGPARTRSP